MSETLWYTLNADGNPIPTADGKYPDLSIEQRRLGRTQVGNRIVSTVFMSLNHNYGGGCPVLFETMVFACNAAGETTSFNDLDGKRYCTRQDAMEGHAAFVKALQAKESGNG